MPLPSTYSKGVVFVGHKTGPEAELVIGGTGFLVRVPATPLSGSYEYVVTAGHVIDHAATATIRGPYEDGGVYDIEVSEWITHPHYDVAVALVDPPAASALVATNLAQFIDDPGWSDSEEWKAPFLLQLGDVVYFVGLLGKIEAMVEQCIPVVRSGSIAQFWQEHLPLQRSPDHSVEYLTAHLIDCRSFGGFSGAPCYVQQSRGAFFAETSSVGTRYRTAFLGLVGGHFDDWAPVRSSVASLAITRSRVNTGIGYVIPAEHIRATLQSGDALEDRERRGGEFRRDG